MSALDLARSYPYYASVLKNILIKFLILPFFFVVLAGCATLNSDPPAHTIDPPTYQDSSDSNLWLLLGDDLQMNHYTNRPEVKARIKWYLRNKGYLVRVAKRGSPYVYYVLKELHKRDMPSELALLPIIESGYDPFAYSAAGAAGLWQMMPGTASGFSLRQNWWYDGRRDIYASTKAALDYLQYLHHFFHGDWLLALAAYNSGEGTVDNAIKYNAAHGKPTDFWDLDLPTQTKQYIPNLLAIASIVAHSRRYHIQWPTTEFTPFLTLVPVGSQIDLNKAAQLAGISVSELYHLNPGFSRWATDPNGDHLLLVPSDKAAQFKKNLAKLPKADRVTWKRYIVKSGDSLSRIAYKYTTSITLIKQINNLKSNTIHVRQVLLIPRAKKSFAHSVLNSIKHYLNNKRHLPGPNRIVHVVQPGDSLWQLAHDYNLTIRDICFWNHLHVRDALVPGTELILWTQRNPSNSHSVKIRPYILHHTVKRGDNLQDIAKDNHIKVSALKKANNLHSNMIRIGQKLIIPPAIQRLGRKQQKARTYRVKKGDSLIGIAHKFGLKGITLKHYNHLTHDTLRIGQKLKIPA